MPDFTARAFGLNRNRPSGPNNAPASRRLSGILNVDPLAIIVTNRRARLGLKPTTISRFEAIPARPDQGRVGPKAVGGFDTLLLRTRTRRGPMATTR